MTNEEATEKFTAIMLGFMTRKVGIHDPATREEALAELALLREAMGGFMPKVPTPQEPKAVSDLSFEGKLAKARARGKKATPVVVKPEPVKQLMLPLWPEQVRGVPNAVLRGALFTVSQERAMFKELTPVAAVDGIEISIKNDRLNQHDLDLFEMLLHAQRERPLGAPVHFTAHSLLRELGRGTSGKHHKELQNDMARLMGSVVKIHWTAERKTFMGSLVERAYIDEATDHWVIEFSQDLMKLYSQGHTWIDWEERKALGRNNLAKWAHGFYTSHAKPFAYNVDTLWKLTGSTSQRKEFRRMLQAALTALVEIGAINSFEIDADDLVHVRRTPSKSQGKHLRSKVIHKKG